MRRLRRLVPVPVKALLGPAYRRVARRSADSERPPGLPRDREKHEIIRTYARRFACELFVETGTYEGDTVAAVKREFDAVYTIELDPEVHRRATRRFVLDRRVHVIHGDGAETLERLLPSIERPTLFWLDAHYWRGMTAKGKYDPPLLYELQTVLGLGDARHVVLIDDARLRGSERGYPSLSEIEHVVRECGLDLAVEVDRDVIRIFPVD